MTSQPHSPHRGLRPVEAMTDRSPQTTNEHNPRIHTGDHVPTGAPLSAPPTHRMAFLATRNTPDTIRRNPATQYRIAGGLAADPANATPPTQSHMMLPDSPQTQHLRTKHGPTITHARLGAKSRGPIRSLSHKPNHHHTSHAHHNPKRALERATIGSGILPAYRSQCSRRCRAGQPKRSRPARSTCR